jgi:DNA-binding beta-propeller fold protein YncE
MKKWKFAAIVAVVLTCVLSISPLEGQSAEPLKRSGTFEMPASVHGGFDHLGIDLKGHRLFAAAESAHKVLVFDLRSGKFLRAINGIEIPHAIFVREDLDRIYITDGGPGAVKIYDGETYRLLRSVPLKVDTDSIGYDPATHFLYVVNGGGDAHETFSMLSVVDTTRGRKVADIKINGATLEAMALEKSSDRMYVNNAAMNQVAIVDRKTRTLVTSWPVTMGKRNVAIALDEANHRLFVACRSGVIVVFDTRTGKELQALPIGTGSDDLVFDPVSKRLYAPCGGDGMIYVYQQKDPDHYDLLGKIPSGPKGKNGLLAPQLKRYFVIVPPQGSVAGAIDVFTVQ